MELNTSPDNSSQQVAGVRLVFGNQLASSILNWEEYHCTSDFLIPCDAFTMKISTRNLDSEIRDLLSNNASSNGQYAVNNIVAAITGGMQVKLEMVYNVPNNLPNSSVALAFGYADQIEVETSREGTYYIIRGRNILGPLCDSGINPWSTTYKFVEGQTLIDVVGQCFTDFGITNFWLTDAANRQISTGNNPKTTQVKIIPGAKIKQNKNILKEQETQSSDANQNSTETVTTQLPDTKQYYDPTNKFDLSEKDIKKLQPKPNMTYMQFIEEHLARFHLHCWAMRDGSGVVIGSPDYSGDNYYNQSIVNRLDGKGNNVIHGTLNIDYFSQPSLIIAKGKQGGGDFASSVVKCARVNEFLGYNSDGTVITSVQNMLNNFKGLKPIALTTLGTKLIQQYSRYFIKPTFPRVAFIEQHDTATQNELEGYVNRKMAEFQKHAFVLKYTVQDHISQNGTVWMNNMIVDVDDENLVIKGQFWVQAVTFNKSRRGGTTTDLTLIPIGTMQF